MLKRLKKTSQRLWVAGLLLAGASAFAVADDQQVGNSWQGKPDPAAHLVGWSARKPVVKDGKILAWEVAPEFLKWRDADPAGDGFAGQVLTVKLTGPFAKGAWSQHAGALLRLDQEVPAKQPFTVRFKARSLSGSKNLSVLRSWGGATPWESIAITPEWQEYAVTLALASCGTAQAVNGYFCSSGISPGAMAERWTC